LEETGEGCDTCNYDDITKKFVCTRCSDYYSSNSNYLLFNKKCINIEERNLTKYKGCLEVSFNEKTKKYECIACRRNNVFIAGEKICKDFTDIGLSSSCLEAESIKSKD